tara:strand:+ start:92 stop:433 length:342 start_codon:yes stop_codon:yes gene_type:complete
MIRVKHINIAMVCLFFSWMAFIPAIKSADSREKRNSHGKGVVERKISHLAENNGNPEDENTTGSTEKNGSEQKTEPKKKSTSPKSREKTAPRKPFVPSEKVKADQAVDFPYDI